jgi:hypothetical protein
MKLINAVGNWQVLELDTQDPIEYCVTDNNRLYYNRDKEAALRLAVFIDKREKESDDGKLQPA